MASAPETTANLFLKYVRQFVRLLRWGSREVRFALVGALLLVLDRWVHALKEDILLAKMPRWVQPGISTALGLAGGLCLLLAAHRVWRKVAAPPLESDGSRLPALKGAASFGPQDADLFARLGRDDELKHLRGWILDDQTPLVAIMGESGVGKTSLLRAGLASSLQHDGVSMIYWEALPTSPEAGLLHAVRSAWRGSEPAPDSIEVLAAAIASRPLVIVLDQFEQLSPERHPGVFSLLRQIILANPPYQATWIVAFRREYAATWREFEVALPDHTEQRIETLPVNRFLPVAARRAVAVLAEEAGLAIDQAIVGELVDSIAVDGKVSPMDIGITLLGLGELTGVGERELPLTLNSFRASGGQAGLLTRYLERVLGQFPAEEQGELLLALLALANLERDQRNAEGKDLSALEESARPLSPKRFATGLWFLASAKARVLENLATPQSEPRYRLVHEKFIPALRSLTGVLVAEAQRACMLLERDYRVWRMDKRRRHLLSGRELRLVLRHQGHFPWGEDELGKREFLRNSERQRAVLRALAVMSCMAMLALSLGLRAELDRRELRGRLAVWNLPTGLGEQLDQLEELHLSGVDTVDWLSAARHLQTLSVIGPVSWTGLPPSLRSFTIDMLLPTQTISPTERLPRGLRSLGISASFGSFAFSLAGLPPGLRSLSVSGNFGSFGSSMLGLPQGLQSLTVAGAGNISLVGLPPGLRSLSVSGIFDPFGPSIAGLPRRLQSLTIGGAGNISLVGLPPGLLSLTVVGIKVTSLVGLPLGLRSLTVDGFNRTSLAELPPGLQSLTIWLDPSLTSLPGLPPGLRSLKVDSPSITSLAELPLGLQFLTVKSYHLTSLAGLPPGLRSLEVDSPSITSVAGLPPGLRFLTVKSDNLTSLAGLPPGLLFLKVVGSQVTSLAGLPSGLRSLTIDSPSITSLVGLPPGLLALTVNSTSLASRAGVSPGFPSLPVDNPSITSLAGLPPGLLSLTVNCPSLTSLAGLPLGLQSLTAYPGDKLNSLAGLPPGLQSLTVEGGRLTSLTGLPAELRKLSLRLQGSIRKTLTLPPSVRVLWLT